MAVSVRFELTMDDAKALHERAQEVAARTEVNKWARRHRWALVGWAAAATVGLGWLYVGWVRGGTEPAWIALMGMLFPVVIHSWGVVRSVFRKAKRERIEEPWFAQIWEGHRCGPHHVTISENGIREVTPGADVAVGWEIVNYLEETEGHIFVDRRGVETLIVPKRALGAAEARELVAELQRGMRGAASDPESRVRVYLAERDFPCPGCRYNLRGVAALACPECGRELSEEGLRLHDLIKEKEKALGKRVVARGGSAR